MARAVQGKGCVIWYREVKRRAPEKMILESRPEQGGNEASTNCRKTPRKTKEKVQRAWGSRVLTA